MVKILPCVTLDFNTFLADTVLMKVVLACKNPFLSRSIGTVLAEVGIKQVIRTGKLERLETELKSPGKVALIDMEWEDIQRLSLLKKLINIASICGNPVACICPNTEEDLKKLARAARATEVFIRYEIDNRFKDWLNNL